MNYNVKELLIFLTGASFVFFAMRIMPSDDVVHAGGFYMIPVSLLVFLLGAIPLSVLCAIPLRRRDRLIRFAAVVVVVLLGSAAMAVDLSRDKRNINVEAAK